MSDHFWRNFDPPVRWNIPPDQTVVDENSEPKGVLGTNTSRKLGYTPPCPPNGEHRYFFRLYALDTELDLSEGSSKDELLSAMKGHVIDMAELMGLYGEGRH